MTIKRVIKSANHAFYIGYGCNFGNFFRANNLGLQTHIPMLGTFGDQHVKTVLIIGKGDTAHMV